MNLHDVLMLIADCSTLINLTDKNGRTIHYLEKCEFTDFYNNYKVNYIDLYDDICTDTTLLEINIDYEVPNAKEFK